MFWQGAELGNKGESGCSPLRRQRPAVSAGLNRGLVGQEPECEPGPRHSFDPKAEREEESSKNVRSKHDVFRRSIRSSLEGT